MNQFSDDEDSTLFASPSNLHLLQPNQAMNTKHAHLSGKLSLHLAAERGNKCIVGLLVDAGAVIDAFDGIGLTALHYAAKNGHRDVVAVLLEKGANIDVRDSRGWTALHLAVENGNEHIVRLLLQQGANLHMKTGEQWHEPSL